MSSQPQADIEELRSRLVALAADLQRVDASLEMHQMNLESIVRTHPDTPEAAKLAGASGAIAAKERLKNQIEQCRLYRKSLLGSIAQAEAHLPVPVKPMKSIRFAAKSK